MEEPKSYLLALSLALVMAPKKVSDGWGAAFAIRVRTDAQTAFPCSGTGTQTCHWITLTRTNAGFGKCKMKGIKVENDNQNGAQSHGFGA